MPRKMNPQEENCNHLSTGSKEWFETWFDSPYYHILYQHRDEKEAEFFLDNLISKLQVPLHSRVLDVGCGKGRHSIFLNKRGLDVTGFDLSAESIAYDKQFENDSLEFYRHDMRQVFRVNYFDLVLNLFSSFGYFDTIHDSIRCMQANSTALKKNGIIVLDYFNAEKVRSQGKQEHEIKLGGINFQIRKIIEGNKIKKEINFNDKGKSFHFEEQVWLFSERMFEEIFHKSGLEITAQYGNYNLDNFNIKDSDRLILVAKKRGT